jgi:hypothetical protein
MKWIILKKQRVIYIFKNHSIINRNNQINNIINNHKFGIGE